MLVNEHSARAAEMVAAFASEYRLATVIGEDSWQAGGDEVRSRLGLAANRTMSQPFLSSP